ncbi:sensor domain-containing diguanylate cyclase [Ferrimonas pelagia]|uniref:diguanylate cyclase n=1 Tax=Ferrimonas pelagia TaxID=1177826 RepID=A0ABP9EJ70_9GAMM
MRIEDGVEGLERHAQQQWQRLLDVLSRSCDMQGAYLARCTEVELHVLATSRDCPQQVGAGERMPIFDLYCEWVMVHASPLAVEDATRSTQWASGREAQAGVLAYLGLPIHAPDGELFGTLCLCHTQPIAIPAQWHDLMMSVVSIIESELRMLQLTREYSRRARTDPLTGLGNRYGVELGLNSLLDWGRRLSDGAADKLPLGVILLELDQFHALIEQQGHSASERVLRFVADLLKRNRINQEMAVRWQGHRFLLLVPAITKEDLLARSEQLRCEVQRSVIQTGEAALVVTASVGALGWDGDGGLPWERLRQCLRQAQGEGGNRCVIAELGATFTGAVPFDEGEQPVHH